MRFAIALALSALVAAQDDSAPAASGPIPKVDPLKAKVASKFLPQGTGRNASCKSSALVQVAIMDGVGGTMTFTQTITPSTRATDSVIQSWLSITGAADNGQDVIAIASDTQGPYVKKGDLSDKVGCGKPFTMTQPGYERVSSQLSTDNCSLKVLNAMSSEGGRFTQTVTAGVLPEKSAQSLLLGAQLKGKFGFNWYANNGKTAALLDHWESPRFGIVLDGAAAPTVALMTSVAAVYAMTF